MSNTLEDRLNNAKEALVKLEGALTRQSGQLPTEIAGQFLAIAAFSGDVDHWTDMLTARATARGLLNNLETSADDKDCVSFGSSRAKFQTVRLLGVQAYLAVQWALADRIVGMAGHVLCTRNQLQDPKNAPQLVSHFIAGKGPESRTAAIVFSSLRQSFGWPIAISYALRNHFLHDGAGGDFFDGPTAAAGFKVSTSGWDRIEERAKEYKVDRTCSRLASAWTPAAGDDLRNILDRCEQAIDEALGVLVGSACKIASAHAGFMLGDD
jgi:hypothetical protein